MTTSPNSTNPVQDPRLLVHAYFDGELDTANALAVKQQIDADPILAAQLENYAALQNAVRRRMPREHVSPHLRARINAAIGTGRRWPRPTWGALAASILVAATLSSGSTWLVLRSYQASLATSVQDVDDQVAFPRELGVLFATFDTAEIRNGNPLFQVRESYADQATLDSVRAGRPVPYGAVLVRAIYDVQRDANGAPVRNASGRLTKTKLLSLGVMEKRAGWGGRYPAGEWGYQSFAPDGTRNVRPAPSACFACHLKVQAQEFVFSFDLMKAARH
jgi:hypothetical protein